MVRTFSPSTGEAEAGREFKDNQNYLKISNEYKRAGDELRSRAFAWPVLDAEF